MGLAVYCTNTRNRRSAKACRKGFNFVYGFSRPWGRRQQPLERQLFPRRYCFRLKLRSGKQTVLRKKHQFLHSAGPHERIRHIQSCCRPLSVSYTHLDVYKRQSVGGIFMLPATFAHGIPLVFLRPVSSGHAHLYSNPCSYVLLSPARSWFDIFSYNTFLSSSGPKILPLGHCLYIVPHVTYFASFQP